MAEKKFLDAAGLEYFWTLCRLQDDENFQTNLEIFDAMASALEKLKEDIGMPEKLPNDAKNLYELVEKNKNQSVTRLTKNGEEGYISWVTGDGNSYSLPIINKDDDFWLATDSQTGLMKLYFKPGQNEDGTMSQKAITDELNKKVGVKINEETLIFTI